MGQNRASEGKGRGQQVIEKEGKSGEILGLRKWRGFKKAGDQTVKHTVLMIKTEAWLGVKILPRAHGATARTTIIIISLLFLLVAFAPPSRDLLLFFAFTLFLS